MAAPFVTAANGQDVALPDRHPGQRGHDGWWEALGSTRNCPGAGLHPAGGSGLSRAPFPGKPADILSLTRSSAERAGGKASLPGAKLNVAAAEAGSFPLAGFLGAERGMGEELL